jgi:outer membrane protein OmpA-like peptidoglycan-associated protein
MDTQNDGCQGCQGARWPVLFGILLLAAGLVIGIVIYQTDAPLAQTTAAAAADATAGRAALGGASGSAPGEIIAMPERASVWVDDGVVKFYFASGSTELAAGAREALADVVMGVAAGKKAVISGYHDATGDPAQNEELARQRALAVRDALTSLGIGEDKIELRKPEETTAAGSNAEARRVEVRLE